MNARTLPLNAPKSVPHRLLPRLLHWDDERNIGNCILLTLAYGWRSPSSESHTIAADNIKDAVSELRTTEPCSCDECRVGLSKVKAK